MNTIFTQIKKTGIVPVVVLICAKDAHPLGEAYIKAVRPAPKLRSYKRR